MASIAVDQSHRQAIEPLGGYCETIEPGSSLEQPEFEDCLHSRYVQLA